MRANSAAPYRPSNEESGQVERQSLFVYRGCGSDGWPSCMTITCLSPNDTAHLPRPAIRITTAGTLWAGPPESRRTTSNAAWPLRRRASSSFVSTSSLRRALRLAQRHGLREFKSGVPMPAALSANRSWPRVSARS